MAGRIVTAKLYNQRRVLQRLIASRTTELRTADCGLRIENPSAPEPAQPASAQSAICNLQSTIPDGQSALRTPQSALDWLDALFAPISRSQTLDELRGYEGASTARYFQAWAAFLPGSSLSSAALLGRPSTR